MTNKEKNILCNQKRVINKSNFQFYIYKSKEFIDKPYEAYVYSIDIDLYNRGIFETMKEAKSWLDIQHKKIYDGEYYGRNKTRH